MANVDDLQKQYEAQLDAFIREQGGGASGSAGSGLASEKDANWALVRALVHRGVHLAAERQAGEFCAVATLLTEMVAHAHGLMHGGDPASGKHGTHVH